jgi:group I intron endonuclease
MTKYNSQSCVYVIVHLKSGKVYIGQAQHVQRRWYEHKRTLNNGKHHNRYLQRAWDKYGEKAFRFRILEHCSVDTLNEREQHYLNIYISKGNCYNISVDAVSGMRGRKSSDETREKIRLARLGTTLSEATKQKLRVANKGKIISEEARRKSSQTQKGRIVSNETREKMSAAKKGKAPPNKGKPSPLRGIPLSEDHKRNLSAAKIGHVVSEETRQKLREAAIRQHSDKQGK